MSSGLGKLRIRLEEPSTGGTLYLETLVVPELERWFIDRIAVMTDTTDNVDCEISIVQRAYNHVIHSFVDLTASEFEAEQIQTWIFPGERLRFGFDGLVAGEMVYVHITGSKRFE